jgi:hypothetical protein
MTWVSVPMTGIIVITPRLTYPVPMVSRAMEGRLSQDGADHDALDQEAEQAHAGNRAQDGQPERELEQRSYRPDPQAPSSGHPAKLTVSVPYG